MQYGASVLRNSKNDHAALKNAIELLRRMGYVEHNKYIVGDIHYSFSESLILSAGFGNQLPQPDLENGNEYTIESLPLFDDLIPYQESNNRDVFSKFAGLDYKIKVPD